jgi:hypothetical protein
MLYVTLLSTCMPKVSDYGGFDAVQHADEVFDFHRY